MENGYYLSLYIAADRISFLCDFSLRGDQNISLWKLVDKKLSLIHVWELERITGIKGHDMSFMDKEKACMFLNELLKRYDLCLDDIKEIWGLPLLDTCSDYHSMDTYKNIAYHSIGHIFSALMFDTNLFYNSNMLVLSVDGGPDGCVDYEKDEKPYYAGCYSENGNIIDIFPINSPGPLWSAAKRTFRMREGTLMALATASKCYLNTSDFTEGVAYEIDSANNVQPALKDYCQKMKEKWEKDKECICGYDKRFSEEENYISAIMKKVNKQSLKIMCDNIEMAITKYGIKPENTYLAVVGGYGLNCPTNSKLLKKYKFKGFVSPPCVNDTGLSIGIGLYGFYKKLGKFDCTIGSAFYGDEEINDVRKTLEQYKDYIHTIDEYEESQVVDDILNEPVIWFQGKAEMGPRALGHRSIIGDPRKIETKEFLNHIKLREWWRPVAPIVLKEDVQSWFGEEINSPYMLQSFKINEKKEHLVPAIIHLDKSARIQTLTRQDNEKLYNIILEFKKRTGVPILCNTSLNDKGEPIINSLEEAINFALRKKIKVVYIDDLRIVLKKHELYEQKRPLARKYYNYFFRDDHIIEELLNSDNPYGLSKEELAVYLFSPRLKNTINIKKEKDVKMLRMLTQQAKKRHPNIAYGGENSGCS
ncbi:carbamoyltransferase C-terminal domain-containing protein [Sellimonas sp.]|uniref:carbamoyltransferase C-terminal domain-containing protein n=1 Tax=Sellimonas sp. TaxID=2021466 RepID=UPI00257CFDD8|nr:carbamoyltransferase C-terminal domain-containing protein [Sellimonas sp.]